METKNKLTVTRREEEGDNGGKKRKGHQGTCIKDPWAWTTGWGRLNVEVGGE